MNWKIIKIYFFIKQYIFSNFLILSMKVVVILETNLNKKTMKISIQLKYFKNCNHTTTTTKRKFNHLLSVR